MEKSSGRIVIMECGVLGRARALLSHHSNAPILHHSNLFLACIIHAPRKNYDTVSIEERAWRSEGTETNTFNAVSGARLGARIFPRCSLHNVGLQASPRQRPIAFALKGALLDHC